MSIRIGGHIIAVPISSSPALVPVLRTHALCLGITQASMHVFLLVLVRIQPQEFICMPDVVSGGQQGWVWEGTVRRDGEP